MLGVLGNAAVSGKGGVDVAFVKERFRMTKGRFRQLTGDALELR